MFVVIVESEEARSGVKGNPIVTREGSEFIATIEADGWVEATSSNFHGKIPADAKTFGTYGEAEGFAKRWEGHPWWCRPNGNYKIVEVEPVIETIHKIIGYDHISDGPKELEN